MGLGLHLPKARTVARGHAPDEQGRDKRMAQNSACVGIDVSSSELVVCLLTTSNQEVTFTVTNDEVGHKSLLKKIKPYKPSLVGLEATGGYEKDVVSFLRRRKVKTWVIEPKRVRQFARASGRRAKNDRIDALMISKFVTCYADQCPDVQPADQSVSLVRQCLTFRRQLVEMKIAIGNQARLVREDKIKGAHANIASCIKQQIKLMSDEINKIISSNHQLAEIQNILTTIKGAGPILVATILAELPEIGKIDRRKIASLAGIAPFSNESGKFKGTRSISGGRLHLRNALYMATLSVVRYNPIFKAAYEKLLSAGKKPKVALVAVMRRLLGVLNAMVRHGKGWDENYLSHPAT